MCSSDLVAGLAQAQSSVTATYGVQDLEPNTAQNHVINFVAKTAINSNLAVDAGIQTTTADVANTVTNRYEAGLTAGTTIGSLTPDVRLAIGQKQKSARHHGLPSRRPCQPRCSPGAKAGL